jgi:nucleotide sugar dehydrogenase
MQMRKTKLKDKVGIVGHGYVGNAMSRFFDTHYPVTIYDEHTGPHDKNAINQCDVAFICVPTQENPYNHRCVTKIVLDVMDWVDTPYIVIKSTVEPGTTKKLKEQHPTKRIVFAPEFCGESTYWSPYAWDRDVKETPFFIFGGDPHDTKRIVDLYLPITGPAKQYRQTDSLSAEIAKYVINSFAATKIAYCYEIANICKEAGADYNEIRELWMLDPRVNPMHTAVFEANNEAFGGKCLPKDIAALAYWAAEELGYDPVLLKEVLASNERIGEYRKHRRH